MVVRVCSTPGCPNLTQPGARGGRCTNCARRHDRSRGTRDQRGYGAAHQAERQHWQQRIDAGETVLCWRCGLIITADDEFDLGHDDHDRTITRGPEHRRKCNRAAAGRASHGL